MYTVFMNSIECTLPSLLFYSNCLYANYKHLLTCVMDYGSYDYFRCFAHSHYKLRLDMFSCVVSYDINYQLSKIRLRCDSLVVCLTFYEDEHTLFVRLTVYIIIIHLYTSS